MERAVGVASRATGLDMQVGRGAENLPGRSMSHPIGRKSLWYGREKGVKADIYDSVGDVERRNSRSFDEVFWSVDYSMLSGDVS